MKDKLNSNGNVLFESELEPTSDKPTSDKSKNLDDSEIEIKPIFRRGSKVAIGIPIFENITPQLIDNQDSLSSNVKKDLEKYEFHMITLSCSFLPIDSIFRQAIFEIELLAYDKNNELSPIKPVVYSAFPDEIINPVKEQKTISISPELSFKFGGLDLGLKLFNFSKQDEYLDYTPEVYFFGQRRTIVNWHFKSTKEKKIFGDKNDLMLIVRSPKNTKLKGRFSLDTELLIDRWIFKTKIDKGLSEKIFELSE
jgi:hypothetical protein